MKRRNRAEEAPRRVGDARPPRRFAGVALASALLLPLLVAGCGEDEVAKQEPAAPANPPATAEAPATTTTPPAPAGVPGAIESTDKAIQTVPPAQPGKQ